MNKEEFMKSAVLKTIVALGMAIGVARAAGATPVEVDKEIKSYAKVSGVSGNLSSVGSDTLNNVMTLWAESFQKLYPNVRIQIEGKGSSTAPPALIASTAQIGPMSRPMKPTEIDEFEKKFGYPPLQIRVAVDALAIYVNKDNITLTQADAIFAKTRTWGGPADITTWGPLGLTGEWAAKPLSMYGRNSASGTYGFFKEHALCNGDFKDTVKEQPGSASVVQGVAEDRFGIGYSGIGYKTSGVKALKLAAAEGKPYSDTEAESVFAGTYPLSRYLFLYVNKAPNKALDPLVREFLLYTLSRDGQEVVVKDGYLPIPHRVAEEELVKVK
jgi:phosphate transport system substrate-binding protein